MHYDSSSKRSCIRKQEIQDGFGNGTWQATGPNSYKVKEEGSEKQYVKKQINLSPSGIRSLAENDDLTNQNPKSYVGECLYNQIR